ncbi:hypothetical protein [Sphingopyxis panaciterrae]
MFNYRSPKFLWTVGGSATAGSIGIFLLRGEIPVAWALLVVAFATLVEASTSQAAAQIGAMLLDKDSDEVERLSYRLSGAMLRCCYLGCFGASAVLFGRGGYNLLPDDGWVVAFIFVPILLYYLWAGASYFSSISQTARRENWQRQKLRS